mmetsp:Transcript_12410/g.39254  ORF Transcript_12410/g.39254 Transcript_12410/m.39254 type:complete len:330 (+) Transcript_12410:462-1451(+)
MRMGVSMNGMGTAPTPDATMARDVTSRYASRSRSSLLTVWTAAKDSATPSRSSESPVATTSSVTLTGARGWRAPAASHPSHLHCPDFGRSAKSVDPHAGQTDGNGRSPCGLAASGMTDRTSTTLANAVSTAARSDANAGSVTLSIREMQTNVGMPCSSSRTNATVQSWMRAVAASTSTHAASMGRAVRSARVSRRPSSSPPRSHPSLCIKVTGAPGRDTRVNESPAASGIDQTGDTPPSPSPSAPAPTPAPAPASSPAVSASVDPNTAPTSVRFPTPLAPTTKMTGQSLRRSACFSPNEASITDSASASLDTEAMVGERDWEFYVQKRR